MKGQTITLYIRKKKGSIIFFIIAALVVGFILGRVSKTPDHVMSELDPPMPKIQGKDRSNLEKTVATSDYTNLSVSLKRNGPVAYINIETQPMSADIYIDNKRLAEKLPVIRYPVLADKTIIIKAINPTNNTSDEQKVLVKADTIRTIILYLKKNP